MKALILSFVVFMTSLFIPNQPLSISSDLQNKLEAYYQAYPQEKIYLHTDRTMYDPGEDLWFKIYLTDGNNQPSNISQVVYVELIDPKGSAIKKHQIVAMNGNAVGDFKLEEGAPGGLYKIRAWTQWMKNFEEGTVYEKEITVQENILPRLLMKLDFEEKAYGPGDLVTAELNLNTLENEALANYNYRFLAQLDGNTFTSGNGMTNGNGTDLLSFSLPADLKTNDGLLNVLIDYNGQTESIARSVPIVLNDIDLQFFPEGGNLVSDLETVVAFKAIDEFGKPADIDGVILDNKNNEVFRFSSFHDGMGKFDFKPEKGKVYKAKITRPSGIKQVYDLPKVESKGVVLNIEQSKTKNALDLKIGSTALKPVFLLAQMGEKTFLSKKLNLNEGNNTGTIPLDNFPVGITRLTLFDNLDNPLAERLVFVNKERELQIDISTNKEKYLPREKVEMQVSVKDEKGKPVYGSFSLSVVDDKLLSFADDKQAHILSELLINSELKGEIHEPNFYFDKKEKKADKALDLLMLTNGWRGFEWEEIKNNKPVSLRYAAEKATIRGKVIDRTINEPIVNAQVCVLETGMIVSTDENGAFEFSNIDLTQPVTIKAEIDSNRSRIYSVNEFQQELLIQKSREVKGVILDEANGEPLIGANIIIKGTRDGTIADIDGQFVLSNIPADAKTIRIVYIGYEDKEVPIESLTDGVNEIYMDGSMMMLEEVVVTGAGRRGRAKNVLQNMPGVNRNKGKKKRAKQKEEKLFDRKDMEMADGDVPAPPPAIEVVEEEMDFDEVVVEMEIVEEEKELADENFDLADNDFRQGNQWNGQDEKMRGDQAEIFAVVEEMPEFPGGEEAMLDFIYDNLMYPPIAFENGIEGMVVVSFTVMPDGSLQNATVRRDIGGGCGKESIRVIEKMPKWKPGTQRGQNVSVQYNLPIRFNLEETKFYDLGIQFAGTEGHYPVKVKEGKYYLARKFYSPKYEYYQEGNKREDFRKTIYWNPNVLLDQNGKANLEFYNSDEISQYRVTIEGMGGGLIAHTEKTFYTQLPFSLDAKIPPFLTFEDQLHIPIILKNNTDQVLTGDLSVNAPDGVNSIADLKDKISIPANSVYRAMALYEVGAIAGRGNFSIFFEGAGGSDAIKQSVEIVPKGFPQLLSFASDELSKKFDFNIQDFVPGSMTVRFAAYPSMTDELMDGVEGLLREPRGCFEQTSSSTYPNIMALRYMEETGEVAPEIRKKAMEYIKQGYKRLAGYETAEDGFEWFGKTPPHEGLTAYGLMEFVDMQKVYKGVDKGMIKRTAKWLMSRKDGKGSFQRSPKALDSFGRADDDIHNAYIVYALSEAGYEDIILEFETAYNRAMESNDAYRIGLMANTAYNLGENKKGDKLMHLIQKQVADKTFKGLQASHSITRSGGNALIGETTALLLLAEMKSTSPNLKFIGKGINVLTSMRGSYGRFASTQSTILALKALQQFTKFSKRTKEGGTIEIYVNGVKAAEQNFGKDQTGLIEIMAWENHLLEAGAQNIEVKFKGTKQALPYTIDIAWAAYTPDSNEKCPVKIETTLNQDRLQVGETVRLTTTVENSSRVGLGSPIAKVGIPSGLSLQPWQLKELVEKEKIAYYEIWDNYVVFYWRDMAPKARFEVNLDLKAEMPGLYEAPSSTTYLYYTDEFKDWTAGTNIEVLN